MHLRHLACSLLVAAFASQGALAQCPVGNDLFRFPDAEPPTGPLKPPPGLADGAPGPGTTVPDPAKPPYSAFGRLDTLVEGVNRYCTAQLIEGTNVLLTAAHCVRDNATGNWVSDFRFWRAGKVETTEPLRKPLCIATKKDWVGVPPPPFGRFFWPADYAFIVLREPLDGPFLKLGSDATAASVAAFGYPAAIGLRKALIKTQGQFAKDPDFALGVVQHADPALGLGMSGGAWVSELTEAGGGTANVVLGLSTTVPTASGAPQLMGPQFTVCAKELLDFARTACAQQ